MSKKPLARDGSKSPRASLELLYHISRELASALDLRTVLQRVVELSLEATEGNAGSIVVLDDRGNPVESAIVYSGQVYARTTEQLRETLEKGLAGWVVREQKIVLVKDTSRDERWALRPDDAPERTGSKSAIAAPLMAREQLVGVMTLVHPTPNTFTEAHKAMTQAVADQAGIAVLNARLYAESQRQARVMAALAESAMSITTALGVDETLNRILDYIQQALHVEAVSLALTKPQEDVLEMVAARGPKAAPIVGLELKMGEGVAGWVAQNGEGIIIPKAATSPHFNPDVDRLSGYTTQAIACAPIRSQGRVIGILEALNPLDGAFEPDALLVLSGIGSLAGTVIQHAQLFESLQAALQSFSELFEDSIDPIVITNWSGQIVEANRQAVIASGVPKQKLQTLTIHQLHAVDDEKIGAEFENLSRHETISYESVLHANPETEIPIQVYVRQIMLEEVHYVQWILRDITESKRLDTMRDDLISMIYHDLRSPLANVVYSMDILGSMLPEDDGMGESLINVAIRSTERIQRLTSSLLDLNRLEAGQSVISQKLIDFSKIVDYAIEAIAPIAESKQQKITTEFPDEFPRVFADPDMIRRVVINILENAIKYTPLGGEITLGGRELPNEVQIWVQDTGPGIPPEKADGIFDKYTRLHTSGRGVGLGLAFCRLAVEGHGGEIWVETELEQGSCFAFSLPLKKT